jgi:hypothetical protein
LDAPPETSSIQDPTLMGEVTLKTRNMLRARSGRPRSETRSAGDTTSAAAPTYSDVFARRSLPATRASPWSTLDAPARPPKKR